MIDQAAWARKARALAAEHWAQAERWQAAADEMRQQGKPAAARRRKNLADEDRLIAQEYRRKADAAQAAANIAIREHHGQLAHR